MTFHAKISLRALAGVALVASNEASRYYLNGVYVEITARQTIYVATDGHRLLAYRVELDKGDPDNTLIGSWIIPTAQCKLVKLKRSDDDVADLAADSLSRRQLKITHGSASFSFDAVDGTFPSWRPVLPASGEIVSREVACFNWSYVADLCKAVAVIRNDKTTPNATLKQTKSDGPAWLDFDARDIVAVVMPMRLTEAKVSDPRPAWLEAPEPAPAAQDAVEAAA